MLDNCLEIGQIVNTHGLRGEVKIQPWTDYKEVYDNISYVYIDKKDESLRLDINGIKYQKNNVIVKFKGIDTIEMAESFKNFVVYLERDMLGELEEGAYYIQDLIGLSVITDTGELLGVIDDILQLPANDVYVVKSENKKEYLIPVIDDVVLDISLEEKKITIHPLEGLLDL